MSTPKSDSSCKSSESVGSYSFIHDYKPCNGNSSSPDFVPDVKWWLNHHGLERGYCINALNSDAKLYAANYVDENSKTDGESKIIEDYYSIGSKNDPAFCSDHLKHLYSQCKSNGDSWSLGFESAVNNNDLLPNAHLMGLDSSNCLLYEQPEKLCSGIDSNWIGVQKIGDPWWHAVDRDDLASLTSQNSSRLNKNCKHPGVKSTHDEKVSENCLFCFEEKAMDKQTKLPHALECSQGKFDAVSVAKPLAKQGLKDPILQETDRSCRLTKQNVVYSSEVGQDAAKVDSSGTQVPNGDLSRTQLLEALCHSQTRAREAEKLAQEACDEKDHVFDLFFQQASCLFAYRQWLRMLQLETLCLHLRSEDHDTCFSPPYLFPWVRRTNKGVNLKRRGARKKVERQRFNISKFAVAFAIGLGLAGAGAGLLVGWTIGWLFPAF